MFRRQKVAKKLSAEELKSKLYARFDESGSLNQLRTQIRSQLTSELFKMALPSDVNSGHESIHVNLGSTLLPLQVCNWLVYDHLMRQGYQYTLSTFVSETNLPYPDKLLAVGDILSLVGIDNSSPEYKRISDLYTDGKDKEVLHSLLLSIIKSVIFTSEKDNQQAEHVTNSFSQAGETNKLPSENASKFELGMLAEDVEGKTSKIKETTSLESSYYEKLQSVEEEKEKKIRNLRHKLVQELERLHLQEQSLYQEIEQERREIRKERDFLFSEREKLKDKENLILKEQENKLEKKIRELEEMHAAKLHAKDKETAVLQDELREKEKNLGRMEFEMSGNRERFDSLKRELDDINRMYKSVHEKYNSLLDENTGLVRKFESMSDYSILKDELVAKGKEISNLQREIENLHRTAERDKKAYTETVTALELKLKATEPKLHHVQKELSQTRETFHMEEALWHKEKKRLEQDSITSKELYKTVLQRMEEQKQDINDLHQTVHILHYQITSGNSNLTAKTELPDSRRTVPKVTFLPATNNLPSHKNNSTSISQQYREKALSFTSDYKSRLNKLQQEVNEGYDKYSLIYPSFNTKMSFPLLTQSSPTFAYNGNVNQLPFSKNIANTSSKLNFDSSKSFKAHLNLKYGNATFPSFMNKSNDRTEAIIADSKKAISSEYKNIYSGAPSSQIQQAFKTTEMCKPSSVMNKMYGTYQESEDFQTNLFKRTDQNRLDISKSKEISSEIVKTISTELTEGFSKDIPVTVTKDFPITEIGETANSSIATAVSVQKSFLFPTASNENSFADDIVYEQSTHSNLRAISVSQTSSDPANETASTTNNTIAYQASSKPSYQTTSTTNFRDTAVLQTFSDPNDQVESTTTITDTAVRQISSDPNDQGASAIKRKHDPEPEISLDPNNQLASSDSLNQHETAPVIVDLDAAWKRKMSLPPVNPLGQNPNPLTFVKNFSPDYNEEQAKQISSVSNPLIPNQKVVEKSSNTKRIENTSNELSSITYDQNTVKNLPQRELPQTPFSPPAREIKKQTDESERQLGSQSNKSVNLSDVSGTDEEIREKRKLDNESQGESVFKQTVEDSLSELSEVHMSCGSEQEEQKEESDNW